jgi:8-oxo-dGTP pyrophosphatase MutT (NUDIX family)
VDRARALVAGTLQPAEPKHAATVVLVRDAAAPRPDGRLEVFLLRRVTTMAFAAGMHVFPGGKVDLSDELGADVALPQRWADELTAGDPELLRKVIAAAVRETAEEAGVILAPDQLRPFAHWVTPEIEPRRYDTRFLIAALPAGQRASLADGEADRGSWVSPAAATALQMMPPTRAALADLADCVDVAAALARTRAIRRIQPRLVPDGDTLRFTIDDGPAEER